MTISDKTTYSEIKQSILGHDQATKTWASEQVIKSLEMKPHDPNGPQPMEVDSVNRIEDYTSKGKGKYKGKNKGKHGGWIPWQPYGRGKGGLKGKRKGKSKGKNKGKQKGKGNNKGKQGNCKSLDSQQCKICHCYKHWSKACPQKVNQVQEQASVGSAPSRSIPSSGMSATTSAVRTAVRRIFQIGTSSSSPSGCVGMIM